MKLNYAIFCFVYAFLAFCAALKNCDIEKDIKNWSLQRKWYVACWCIVAFLTVINGLRFFVTNHTFNFFAQFAFGVQFLLVASVPCGIEFFNKPWPVRRIRDALFITIGVLDVLQAFEL